MPLFRRGVVPLFRGGVVTFVFFALMTKGFAFDVGVVAPGVVLPPPDVITRAVLTSVLDKVVGRFFNDKEAGAMALLLRAFMLLAPGLCMTFAVALTGAVDRVPRPSVAGDAREGDDCRSRERGFFPVAAKRESLGCDFRTLNFRFRLRFGMLCLYGTTFDIVAKNQIRHTVFSKKICHFPHKSKGQPGRLFPQSIECEYLDAPFTRSISKYHLFHNLDISP